MSISKASCENCGAKLEQIDGANYKCSCCGTLYVVKDDVLVVKNINNVVNNYYGSASKNKINEQKLEGYFDLIVSDIITGDLPSAREYCLRILSANPTDKLIAKIKANIDILKQSNGRYERIESLYQALDFVNDFFYNEEIYTDNRTIRLVEELLFKFQWDTGSLYSLKELYQKIYNIEKDTNDNRYNKILSILSDCFSREKARNAEEARKQAEEARRKKIKTIAILVSVLMALIVFSVLILENWTYSVVYSANYGGSVVVSDDNTYYSKYGKDYKKGTTTSQVTAVPSLGWYFVGWSDGYSLATRRDIVKDKISVTAKFKCYFTTGLGTKSDPFKISTVAEFKKMIELINSNNFRYSSSCYLLNNSLDFQNQTLETIGNKYVFSGSFYGNGKTLKNLKLASKKETIDEGVVESYGLFSYLSNAYISNLSIDNVKTVFSTSASSNCVYGTLASFAKNSEIRNCRMTNVSCEATSLVGNKSLVVGGLIGRTIGNATLYGCGASFNATVQSDSENTNDMIKLGGLVGDHRTPEENTSYSSYKANLSSCSTSGNLSVNANKKVYIGGIYGLCKNSYSQNISSTCVLTALAETTYEGQLFGLDK